MEQHDREPVNLDRVRRDAACIITRVGLGGYDLEGPAENILVPESRVAWATVLHDLEGEGYTLVTQEEYAAATGIDQREVSDMLLTRGTLFGLSYGDNLVVPLPEKEAVFDDIEVPGTWAPSGERLPEGDRGAGRQ